MPPRKNQPPRQPGQYNYAPPSAAECEAFARTVENAVYSHMLEGAAEPEPVRVAPQGSEDQAPAKKAPVPRPTGRAAPRGSEGQTPAEKAPVPRAGPADNSAEDPWTVVAELRWTQLSDGHISSGEAFRRVSHLADSGRIDAVCQAMGLLTIAVVEEFPLLSLCSLPALCQLIALGENVVRAAGEEPGLLEYLQKEAQPANLAGLLDQARAGTLS